MTGPDIHAIIDASEREIAAVKIDGIRHGATAMGRGRRRSASIPARTLVEHVDITGATVLDMGCGHSRDAEFLKKAGASVVYRYDPCHAPLGTSVVPGTGRVDVVLLSYVLNVLPPAERAIVARCAIDVVVPGGIIFVGVREDAGSRRKTWVPLDDGHVTTARTFQSFFEPGDPGRIRTLFPGMTVERAGEGTWKVTRP